MINNINIKEPGIPGYLTAREGTEIQSIITDRKLTRCVEIGSFYGRSTYFICEALAVLNQNTSRVQCIDKHMNKTGLWSESEISWPHNPPKPWNSSHSPVTCIGQQPSIIIDSNWYESYNSSNNKTILDIFNTTLNRFPSMRDYVTMHVGTIDTVDFEDNKFDFAFIDGDHRYEAIKNDFEKLYPYLEPNAVIAFHDYKMAGPYKFVHESIDLNILHRIETDNVNNQPNLIFLQV